MKALIIDDEPPVITVVKMLVDWDQFQIGTVLTAASSEQALEILRREKPEIILSDINLPGLSGLDLVERLRKEGNRAQVVLISAYDKFSYAQRAVQLDCAEYLLKPIDRETVNRAVAKAVSKYRENSGMQENSDRLRAQNLFSAYLSSGRDPETFEELCLRAPWLKESGSCRVAVVSLRHLPEEGFTQYDIQSVMQEHLYRNQLGVAATGRDSADIVILLKGGSSRKKVKDLCLELLLKLKEKYGLVLHAGISGELPCPAGISEGYRTALDLAVSANLYSEKVSAETELKAVPPLSSLLWIEKVLFAVLEERNTDRIRSTVEELGSHIERAENVTIRQMENFRVMYNSQRSRWIMAKQKEQGETAQVPKEFRRSFCLPDGRFTAERFCAVLCEDLIFLQKEFLPEEESISTADLLRRARSYLEENYSGEISMEDLSRRLGISQSYLSRSFKKETGISPIDYLTQYRIVEACRMLEGEMRTADIASAVGLPDPKYFSRVFKKVKGMSPTEYRETRRQEAQN